ncbi:MAG TPA: outer membrane protein assembly factor BamA [Devosia sp.]
MADSRLGRTEATRTMINPTKLMRGAFLALAVLLAAPVAGVSVPLVGSTQALAQANEQLISSVLFEGNRRFSDKNLLTMVDLASRGTFSQSRLEADIESIRLAYANDGFNGVSVTARVEQVQGGRVRVTFVINEGERAGIRAINFTGNNHINSGTLKGVIRTHETHILSWLFKDDSYTEQKLAIDRELIKLYYANHGYPDAVVTSAVAEYDASKNGYFINFTIDEGEYYEFGSIGIETSVAGLNADALKWTIRTREGGRYTYDDLAKTQSEMAFEATAQGYSFADVRPRLDRDVANHRFNVTYLVDEGPRVYVERINITGNNKTRDFVIRRELDFGEGDPFNRSMVQRGKTSIEALGFFDTVDIQLEPGSAPDKVVININVVEQSTGDYGVTAGYSTADGILGEVSLTERNFLGRGQYLRAAIGATGSGKSFDFSFTEPRFMGLKISAGVDAYYRIVDETATNFYGYNALGGQLRFGLPITTDVSLSLFTGLEQKTIKDETAPFSGIVANGDVLNKAWVGYSLTYDGLDDPKKPTEGLYATFTQQYVGWDHNFLKSEAKARYYLPFLQDTGIRPSLRATAGVLSDFSGSGVRPVEAYQLGPTFVRGFENRGIGPRLGTGEAVGATWYAGGSAEIEFPIPVLPENYGLSAAVWADAGYVGGVGGNGLAIDPASVDNPLKASVGASIIWNSPFGPLRGDVGYVLSKATSDRTQIFQLTLQSLL